MRAEHKRCKEIEDGRNKRNEKKLLDPSPIERIDKLLDNFESGELDAWWRICMDMTLEPDSTHFMNGLEFDLTNLPVWKSTDNAMRERIVKAAQKYILDKELETAHRWINNNTLYLLDHLSF